MAEFPEMKGFSKRNLEFRRQWHLFYSRATVVHVQFAKQPVSQLSEDAFGQQVVAQITSIPWGHNIAIITKCKAVEEALYYVQNTPAVECSNNRCPPLLPSIIVDKVLDI